MLIHNMNYVCWITVLSCMSVAFANTIFLSNSLQFHQTALKLSLNLLTWHTWTSFAAEVLQEISKSFLLSLFILTSKTNLFAYISSVVFG